MIDLRRYSIEIWEEEWLSPVGDSVKTLFFDWKFVSLAHNTIRGAAGGAILTAELLKAKGYLTS